ncbi:MAG: hypothetical protein MZV65_19400 [Chromatiales bacterium]|nr:hypothetical protein [Chromatiales bacterium]
MIYVPGNHDELFRDYLGSSFGGIEVRGEALHETADGRRFLVLHGDEFDQVVKHSKWLAVLGSEAYDFLLVAEPLVQLLRAASWASRTGRCRPTSSTRSRTP